MSGVSLVHAHLRHHATNVLTQCRYARNFERTKQSSEEPSLFPLHTEAETETIAMAELGCYSPSFKKPSDVLRMRRKRARSEGPNRGTSSPVVSVDGVRPFSPGPLLNAPSRTSGGVKRRNPFANIENTYNSPKKRVLSHTDGCNGALDGRKAVLDGKFREELFNTDQRTPHEIKVHHGYYIITIFLHEIDILQHDISIYMSIPWYIIFVM